MRVSPVGFAFDTLEDVLREARTCAEVTHNHPEGVRGAQATAVAIFLAREGETKEAITAFLEASDYEETIRLAISLGGDADTLACIAGGIAEAFYGGVPKDIEERTMAVLDDKLRQTVERFRATYLNLAG